jgi:hypothetical protein
LISDVWTVMWKEWRELLIQRVRLRGGALSLLVVVAVFSIVLPLQIGSDWVESPMVLFFAGWVPFVSTAHVVADSFAGERERHTLETLLASRLSNQAILFGKVCTAVSYRMGTDFAHLVPGIGDGEPGTWMRRTFALPGDYWFRQHSIKPAGGWACSQCWGTDFPSCFNRAAGSTDAKLCRLATANHPGIWRAGFAS